MQIYHTEMSDYHAETVSYHYFIYWSWQVVILIIFSRPHMLCTSVKKSF